MALTDTAIRRRRLVDRPLKLADGGGLYLYVKPSGSRSWRLDYRFGGKRKTPTLGAYPTVGLADARTGREDARRILADGRDPSVEKRRRRVAEAVAAGNTFGLVADEFLSKMRRDGRADATIAKNRWMIIELAADLARRPISDISSAEVLEVLRRIERSGRVETALAMRAAIGRIFRYAIATARAQNDPTFPLRGALQRHVPISHPAVTDASEVGGLMRAISGYDGWPSLRAVLMVQAYCFARPGETRMMEWSEVDIANAVWSMPAGKAKMRRPHDVPLSRQALEVLAEMRTLGAGGRFVFPSMMSGKHVLSENSMNSALRRMGYTHEQHTAHGFRSMASTLLNECRLFHPDVIEAQLAHRDADSVRRIYNRATYWDDRVSMMQWWADFLDNQMAKTTGQ